MSTKPTYGNCLFASLYLIFRGKAKKIVAVSSESYFYPHHYLIANKNGHILHFKHIHIHEKNTYAPWWFEGQFVGIKKGDQEKFLIESGKKVVMEIESSWLGGVFGILVIVLFSIPWQLGWFLFCPVWLFWWTLDALKKRRNN